jgi:hypothetical protein
MGKIPPVVIGLLPTQGKESAAEIYMHLKEILNMCIQANVSLLSVGSDGAPCEINAQKLFITDQDSEDFLIFEDHSYGICFRAPIFNGKPLVRVQDIKHAKKTARNQLFTGARLMTLGIGTARYDLVKFLADQQDSVLYRRDVLNVDKQDDGAAFRMFCSEFLEQCADSIAMNPELAPLFVYLFVFGMLFTVPFFLGK